MKPTLLHQFRTVQGVAKMNLAGLSDQQSRARPQPGGNSLRWILGHLTWTYHGMLPLLDQEPVWDEATAGVFERGADAMAGADAGPSWDDLLAAWETVQKRFIAGVEEMDEARASEPAPYSPGNNPDETLGSLLALIAFHQAYHVGQLGLGRRLAGAEAAIK